MLGKEYERKQLIKRIFPTPYAGYEHILTLFEICRELGDPYCLSFNENGYTTDYKPFKTDEVIDRVTKLLTDARLLHYAKKYKDKLVEWSGFNGKYYTYDQKTRNLTLESEWKKLEIQLDEFLEEYGESGGSVLRVIWEANVVFDKKDYILLYR